MNKGFTLIELLAVIAILAIIIGLSFQAISTVYNKSKDKTHVMSMKSYADVIEDTIFAYMQKNSTLNISVSKDWIVENLNINNNSINCATIYYKASYGVVLGNCSITNASNTYYYYDGIVLKNTDSLVPYNDYLTALLNS